MPLPIPAPPPSPPPDIHPPLAKLTFWLVAHISGYSADTCSYDDRIKYYGPDCQYYVLRMTAAAFSSLTPPLLYLCARLMGATAAGGVLAAGLLIFDGIAVGEGRHVLVRGDGGGGEGRQWGTRLTLHCHSPPLPPPSSSDGQPAHVLACRLAPLCAGLVGAAQRSRGRGAGRTARAARRAGL